MIVALRPAEPLLRVGRPIVTVGDEVGFGQQAPVSVSSDVAHSHPLDASQGTVLLMAVGTSILISIDLSHRRSAAP